MTRTRWTEQLHAARNLTKAERFWNKVEGGDYLTCWDWQAGTSEGYATFDGQSAHRWVYEQMIGEIPPGLQIDHLCFNPSCQNPYHMELVTQAENIRRAHAHRNEVGPSLKAVRQANRDAAPGNSLAHLTTAQICAEMARHKKTRAALAVHMGRSTKYVYRILANIDVIDLTQLELIADFLGTSPYSILEKATA